ncbi:hypothetical protein GCM10010523_02710 [Paenarthrobacter ilicis]
MLGLQELTPGGVEPLEVVLGLDDPGLRVDFQVQGLGGGHGCFLRARQGRCHKVHDLGAIIGAGREVAGQHARHLPAPFGEVEFRQPSVEDAVRIMDLAMAKQMDSCLGHVYQFLKEAERSEIFYRQ